MPAGLQRFHAAISGAHRVSTAMMDGGGAPRKQASNGTGNVGWFSFRFKFSSVHNVMTAVPSLTLCVGRGAMRVKVGFRAGPEGGMAGTGEDDRGHQCERTYEGRGGSSCCNVMKLL